MPRPPAAVALTVRKNWFGWAVLSCLFFALFYVYVWRHVEPRMLYHADYLFIRPGKRIAFPLFQRGAAFFQQFPDRPGGLAEYAGAWASQYLYYPYIGALVLTGAAWLVALAGGGLIRAMGGRASRILAFVPALLILVTYNRYAFQLEYYLALAAAMGMANFYVYVCARSRRTPVRLALFLLTSAMVYYIAAGPYVLFALLCGAQELLSKRPPGPPERAGAGKYVLGGLYLLAAVGIPFLARSLFFDITLSEAYTRLSGIYPRRTAVQTWMISAVYVFVILVVAALGLWGRFVRPGRAGSGKAAHAGADRGPNRGAIVVSILALAAVSPLIAFLTPDEEARILLRANYFARMGMWPEVLREARRFPPKKYTVTLTNDVNRALAETGQLGDKMFSFPQHPRILPLGQFGALQKGSCNTLLRLGCVNYAEHVALEALETFGQRPDTLRQLALINVAKGRPDAARVFLHALRKDIIHRHWAEDCLRRLEDDPDLSSEEEVRHAMSVMPVRNTPNLLLHPLRPHLPAALIALLERDPNNRLAFDYLMAYYLLNGKVGGLTEAMLRIKSPDLRTMREHHAEGMFVLHLVSGVAAHLQYWPVSASTLERLVKAQELCDRHKGDQKASLAALAKEFPNSYYVYCKTRRSGGVK